MIRNVASWDRVGRLVIGALLIAAPFLTGWAIWAATWIVIASVAVGAVLVATAVFGFCPIYAALGLRTGGHGGPAR